MRNSSPKSKEMNIALGRLQYLSQAAPLEKQLSFNELQNRPLGFQTAIPRDPIGESMNSLEFKSMEGAMYECRVRWEHDALGANEGRPGF